MLQNNSNKQYIYCKTRLSILLAQGCDVCLLIETKFLQLIPEYTFIKSLLLNINSNTINYNSIYAGLCSVECMDAAILAYHGMLGSVECMDAASLAHHRMLGSVECMDAAILAYHGLLGSVECMDAAILSYHGLLGSVECMDAASLAYHGLCRVQGCS